MSAIETFRKVIQNIIPIQIIFPMKKDKTG